MTKNAEIKIRYAKQNLFGHGNKTARYLSSLTKKKVDSQTISSITNHTGNLSFDPQVINNTFKNFYENVYKSELSPHAPELMVICFSTIQLPNLTEEQRSPLNVPMSKAEVLLFIKGLQSGKAPGPDGHCCEFYKEFLHLLIDTLISIFNHSFGKNALQASLCDANMSLILKKGKRPTDCASYRPIALLNVDLKILSKVLATRLEKLLPTIVKEDQTGFIKGCNSCNNVCRLLNVI